MKDIIRIYNSDLDIIMEREWIRYGMRFTISPDWLGADPVAAWEYIFLRFWRTPQAAALLHGPLHVRELPYQEWEKEAGLERGGMIRFEIRHWGWRA